MKIQVSGKKRRVQKNRPCKRAKSKFTRLQGKQTWGYAVG